MDPLALAAVVGLVFAGKRLSEDTGSQERLAPSTTRPITRRDTDLMANSRDHAKDFFDVHIMTPDVGRRVGDHRLQKKQAVGNLGDISQEANRQPFGQPVYDLYNRQYITNKMNNVQPLERQRVGPGLGVGADVAATGGFHQYFRALPTNINEERLNTLEGRAGPANSFIKSGDTVIGGITQEARSTKAWTRPPAQGRAAGQGGGLTGPEGRPDYPKARRTTNRQETGERQDTLSTGPAQYAVNQPYAEGGAQAYTDKALTRSSGFRENGDRSGNAGGMNVRIDPLNQGGALTNLKAESVMQPAGNMNASRFQNYQMHDYDASTFNNKKTNMNPLASPCNLDVAIAHLEKVHA